ncbi:acrosin-binding protein isoform X5 [Sminthopsis crassicaudata]|uniref:acrosin-binding protein isoform X5 n=1 Tax=Sminthopsis crassicaudata TaxID=9301 RepID=UPI003D684FF0
MRSRASGLPLPLLAAILLAPTPAPFPAPGPDVSGAPLSPAEYERFFSALTPAWKAETACRLRATQGCQNHKLVQLDQYENHGTLPQGSVCTDLPFASWFESFCQFTQYRCANRLYYAKRVMCSPSPPPLSSPETFTRMDSTTVPFSLPHVATAEEVRPETYLPWNEQIHTDGKDLLQSSLSVEKKGRGSKAHTESPTPPSTRQVRKKNPHPVVIEGIRELIRSAQVLGKQNKTTQDDEDASFERSGLSLPREEAMLVLCYTILSGSCPSIPLTKAWQHIEEQSYNFGNTVCDSLGRRHLETCEHCAFCSLKLEQCQSEIPLKREPCSENHIEEFLSPLLSAQDTSMGIEICDSDYMQYPNYCAFKSHQCLLRNQDKKVFRMRCLKNETYSVLNIHKGEEAILLWSQEFSRLTLGHGG